MSQNTYINQWAIPTLPAGWTGAVAPTLPQRITGTGATEAANATALTPGRYYVVKNVSPSVVARFMGAQASGLTGVVSATASPTLSAGQEFKFMCTPLTRFIYAESASGVFDLVVWESDNIEAQP